MGEAYEIGLELVEQQELSGSLEIIAERLMSLDAAIVASNAGIVALIGGTDTTLAAEIPHRNIVGAAPEMQAARDAPVSRAEMSRANTFGPSDGEGAAAPTFSHLGAPFEVLVGPTVAPDGGSEERSTVRQADLIVPHGVAADVNRQGMVVAPVGIDRERTVFVGGGANRDGWGEPAVSPNTAVTTESAATDFAGTDLAGTGVSRFGEDRRIEIVGPDLMRVEGAAPGVEAVAARRNGLFRTPEVATSEWPSYALTPSVDGVFGRTEGDDLPRREDRRPSRDRPEAPGAQRGGRRSLDAATAPQMAREQVSGAPGGMFSERAAAPQGEGGGRQDDGRAVVMLDGRLVGEMLSSRMARDAARPGAGTTFFDPRQAPAWTPSGSV